MSKEIKMYNFGSISTTTIGNWEEKFDVSYNDDGQLTLVSKETFHHEEEGLNFDYKYVLQGTDLYSATGDDNNNVIMMYLYICPTPEFWCEKKLIDIASAFGYEDMSRENLLKGLYAENLVECGSGVPISKDEVKYDINEFEDGFYDLLENADVVEKLNTVATVFQNYDSIRGFVLDKYVNRIGSTGWDMIEEIVAGGDMVKAALNRWEESKAANE